ncbi:PIG-L family deacetylase [Aquirufa rosea]|uniref:PIG-L family deacetylase n=1 Tax=Aquirufa rosea TaxID=2509241 RepID=A0A4Q1C2I4_9BACT|nr:PIG-L family deacetylase [Aquirufa rosea]RXK52388.1 PIG-L family deacetylase [Aquirufa rosea]
MKKILTYIFSLCSFYSFAQQSNAQLFEDLQSIQVLGTVLHVAAHPDDESTHMLTWFAQEQHWEANYFSCTRGDGGQNLIGDEQGVPLGLLRTQELLAARKIDGAHQYFSQALDFGFSKSTDEALSTWNHELILSNLVWVIRKLQPDIIFTRFPPDSRAGHGHHSASAALAIEAYSAAADPNRFPEQLQRGVKPWQAKRLLWNTFRFPGSANSTINENQFKIQIGNFLPALGVSTGELAALSRSQHKCQGFGFAADRGLSTEYFETLAGDAPKQFLWDGINTSWSRVPGSESVEAQLKEIIRQYQWEKPYASVKAMIALKKTIEALAPSTYQQKKLAQVNQWILKAAALYVSGTTQQSTIATGDTLQFKTEMILRSPLALENVKVRVLGKDTTFSGKINPSRKLIWNAKVAINQSYTQPYWLQKPRNAGHFVVENPNKIGQADVDPAVTLQVSFQLEGETFTLERAVQQMYVDPVKGEIYQPIAITPKSIFSLSSNVLLLPSGSKASKNTSVNITAMTHIAPGKVEVKNELGEVIGTFNLEKGLKKGEKRSFTISFNEASLRANGKIHHQLSLAYSTNQGNWTDSLELHTIEYTHIPTQRYFTSVGLDIIHSPIVTKGKRIGYIRGAGDKVPEALIQMGYQVDFLLESDLKSESLKKYDAIVTGVRAYNTEDYLGNAYPELMKYIENGGNYVVQYNTASFLGPMKSQMAPYPFQVGRSRITRENAQPEFLMSNHSVFTQPNKITAEDFQDWVQERSIYLGESNDSHIEFPLAFTDPGEKSEKGNIAIAKYGKGRFIYTGLVFFRQLPAAVPGAYRLFANLISNPNSK